MTTITYTLSLHDALPIFTKVVNFLEDRAVEITEQLDQLNRKATIDRYDMQNQRLIGMQKGEKFITIYRCFSVELDRKSTRLNSSHLGISYAVFCLKKKIK